MTNVEQILAGRRAIKEKYPAAIVLIKVDNLYQAFDNDAQLLHKILHHSLMHIDTKHLASAKVEFPTAALDDNLAKLLRSGYSVAVCSFQFTASIV